MTRSAASLLSAALMFAAAAAASAAQQPTPQPPRKPPAAAAPNPLNEQLWDATRKGDVAAVRDLIAHGADVNAKWRYDQTPLFKAAERGHTEIVRILLEHNADPNLKDTFYGATPLTWALDKNHVEVVRALVGKGTDGAPEVLLTGARAGNVEYVKIALAKGGLPAGLLTRALTLSTIRHGGEKDEAVKAKRAEIVSLLRAAGAQPPFALDAATLKSYEGAYKSEAGQEWKTAVNPEGFLTVTINPTNTFVIVPSDKLTFAPVEFDGVQITFNVEGDKVTGFNFKQGQNPAQLYKRVEPK